MILIVHMNTFSSFGYQNMLIFKTFHSKAKTCHTMNKQSISAFKRHGGGNVFQLTTKKDKCSYLPFCSNMLNNVVCRPHEIFNRKIIHTNMGILQVTLYTRVWDTSADTRRSFLYWLTCRTLSVDPYSKYRLVTKCYSLQYHCHCDICWCID